MHLRTTLLLLTTFTIPAAIYGQANDIPSAAPSSSTASPEQRGRQLLDQMVAALGGPAWLNRHTMSTLGHTAAFFRDQPTGANIEFAEFFQFPTAGKPQVERIEFITPKGMILPGKKRDVVQVWTPDQGYELTYKGKTPLPKDQVDDYLRRRAHSVEAVVAVWLKAPGVVVVSEGTTTVERRAADKITVLSANNDAVTLDLDANTHLPLARTFEWRNQQFKDHDQDREEYDNYQTYDGLPTPLTLSRYHNGDLVNQRFLSKIDYNQSLPPDTFNPDAPLQQKKK
jgi:hypothetical protein